MNETKIVARDLEMVFDGKCTLNKVNFDVKTGEFLSILGPSGCGKTTILRILVGLLKPTGGTVEKDGEDITRLPAAERGMGIVFQNYALFENMTVLQNVEYALKIRKENRGKAARRALREKALATLAQLGLSDHVDKYPAMLSGGQQQRVAIARTMVLNPDVILFDEPMSALDVDTRLALRAELKRIQKEYGTTMIYITHDQEEAFAMSDRIMIMREANVVQLATPDEIIDHPADEYVKNFVLKNLQIKIDSLLRCVRN